MPIGNVGLRKIQAVFAKVEVTEGTDVVPGATDAIQLLEPGTILVGAEQMNPRADLITGRIEESAPLPPGAKFGEVTFRFYVRGKGSAYATTAGPEAHALIQGAGCSATFNANLWDYDSISVNQPSLSMYAFQGLDTNVWIKHAILGAKVSRLLYTARAGGVGIFDCTVRGKYVAPVDGSPTTPTYQTAAPPVFGATGSWAIGAVSTGLVAEARVGIENLLTPRLSANAADGLAGYAIVSRRLTWGVNVEQARIADYDVFTKFTSAVAEALAIVHGSVQFNRFKVDADKATIQDPPAYQERNGLVDFKADGICGIDGTNRLRLRFD